MKTRRKGQSILEERFQKVGEWKKLKENLEEYGSVACSRPNTVAVLHSHFGLYVINK